MAAAPQRGVHARRTVRAARLPVDLPYLLGQFVLGTLPLGRCRPAGEPGVIGGAGQAQYAAQQRDTVAAGARLGGLLRIDETAQRAYFIDSFAKKAAAFFKISIVCCCSRFSLRSRWSSCFSAVVSAPTGPSP